MARQYERDGKFYISIGKWAVPEKGQPYLYDGKVSIGGGKATSDYPLLEEITSTESENDMAQTNSMVKIEQVTLVDGTDIKDLSFNSLLSMIVRLEADIVALSEVNVDSKAIKARITTMTETCDELAKLLDANHNE